MSPSIFCMWAFWVREASWLLGVFRGGASFRRVGVGGHKMNQLPERLPRAMDPDDLQKLLSTIDDIRDRTMFMLMLRCGLRVEEVANLAIGAIDVNRRTILVEDGKGAKDRIVYMSNDALHALAAYYGLGPHPGQKIFLVEKEHVRGNPSPSVGFRSAWNIMPAKRRSGYPAIISGTPWRLKC